MCIICVYLCVFSQLMEVERFLLGLAEQEAEARSRLQVSSELRSFRCVRKLPGEVTLSSLSAVHGDAAAASRWSRETAAAAETLAHRHVPAFTSRRQHHLLQEGPGEENFLQ